MVILVQHNMQFSRRKKASDGRVELGLDFDSKWHRRDP